MQIKNHQSSVFPLTFFLLEMCQNAESIAFKIISTPNLLTNLFSQTMNRINKCVVLAVLILLQISCCCFAFRLRCYGNYDWTTSVSETVLSCRKDVPCMQTGCLIGRQMERYICCVRYIFESDV